MNVIHYIGLDVHKKSISYCIKTADGRIVREGKLQATRAMLRSWAEGLREPWCGAMEATLFSAWIYDTLKPYAEKLVMGHPARMKAITAGKKKSDTIDARTIADLLRCDLLPSCYVLAPELRDLRRLLRYRNLVVHQSVRMQNRMAGLLMESGASFHKTKLHGKKYFTELMGSLEEVPESVKDLLRMSRSTMEMFESTQKQIERGCFASRLYNSASSG
jgi:transposase